MCAPKETFGKCQSWDVLGRQVDPYVQETLDEVKVVLAVEVVCMLPRGCLLQEQLSIGLATSHNEISCLDI